ncbi:hypothetical protein [Streptomyces morookaense]|uniref:Uncharacterized protein n=1 Tax=Streptomyces morookaense TaxID=1970 RepID=A0A7Y7B722_STRMO|nr:hypothetical protein [Streptomyces morookaense]GHF41670.1 hypothetical protein GCM10010359_50430 [Streptomyces morookaense]
MAAGRSVVSARRQDAFEGLMDRIAAAADLFGAFLRFAIGDAEEEEE